MIIVNLKGGLGNQMFQYACGKALSLRNRDTLVLDISGYIKTNGSDTPRIYSLSHFNIESNIIAKDKDIQRLKYPFGILSKGYRFINARIFRNFNIGWNPRIFSATGDMYLDGFWQTEKYFLDFEDVIRREFTLKNPLKPEAQAMANGINKSATESLLPSVAIHVRRGDVARDAKTNPYYGVCTPEYYATALTHMAKKLGDFRLFVFSDDIDWVKKNMAIEKSATSTTYVSGTITDYEEIILMSMCDHAIIANSSFSWWGAWLNKNPNKIIIAPKEWITRAKNQHRDTVPLSWIRI